MKNLLSFEDFVNENYSPIFERDYFAKKSNPKLAKEYEDKIKAIVEDILDRVPSMKNVEHADTLVDIFPKAKEWWQQGNPNWSFSNPYAEVGLGGKSLKDFKVSDEGIDFGTYNENNCWFSTGLKLKAFVKKEKAEALTAEWNAILAAVGKAHGIPVNAESNFKNEQSQIRLSDKKLDSFSPLWWSDENHGVFIEEKFPELGYLCVKLNTGITLVPTPEEQETLKKAPKQKALWPIIKKVMDPDHSAAQEDQDDDPNLKIGKYVLSDFVEVWSDFRASEDFGIDWDQAGDMGHAIISHLGGNQMKSKADFAVSGAEMRQVYVCKHFPYIRWDWDGTSIFIPKQEIPKFEALCKNLKMTI